MTPELDALRRKHGVRLVNGKEDGTGLHRLPNGVYGYTYSPGLPTAPLFAKSGAHMFEVHKALDGSVVLVGYVMREAAGLSRQAASEYGLSLYPGKRGGADELAAVPMSRVIRLRQQSLRETGAIELHIRPQ